ncbi:hypothetical protein M2349_001307 [Caldanaerobacter subterraneus subsp. tengcongensis MB4]|nr:hypothetical protein [Caldanaerobacter subterraneus subsp. tengcongensis MB4]
MAGRILVYEWSFLIIDGILRKTREIGSVGITIMKKIG